MIRVLNVHYIACIGSLVDLFSARVDFSFAVHKLAKFSANPGKVHFELFIHLLRYIRYNNNLVLKYCANINYALVSDILRQASIKNENQLMDADMNDAPVTDLLRQASIKT